MAQLLYDRDSSAKHINASRRHMRLARRQNKSEFADAIKPLLDAVLTKQKATEEKNELREDAYDDLQLADAVLDDSVRNSYAATQTYDRNYPGTAVMRQIFPDQKFGDIINTPMLNEPDVVEQLAMRFESLGESHPLYAEAALLREKIAASRAAIAAYEAAIRDVKLAEADEEIDLARLRKQYEANYLNSRGSYGKLLAERLFPRLTKSSPASMGEAA